jgi:hypothetical protein
MLEAGPENVAKEIEDKTNVKTIAAFDGAKIIL